jgi:hypothetical protein
VSHWRTETDPVSEALRFPVFRILDEGQSPETQWFWDPILLGDCQEGCMKWLCVSDTNGLCFFRNNGKSTSYLNFRLCVKHLSGDAVPRVHRRSPVWSARHWYGDFGSSHMLNMDCSHFLMTLRTVSLFNDTLRDVLDCFVSTCEQEWGDALSSYSAYCVAQSQCLPTSGRFLNVFWCKSHLNCSSN